jgi:hypothetical protein
VVCIRAGNVAEEYPKGVTEEGCSEAKEQGKRDLENKFYLIIEYGRKEIYYV